MTIVIRSIYFLGIIVLSHNLSSQSFYELSQIRNVKISFSSDLYVNALHRIKEIDKGDRISCDITLDGNVLHDCGIRYKGNSSYFNSKKYDKKKLPFNIKSNYTISGQEFYPKITKMKLSNIFRDPSYLREAYSYYVANKYMPSPMANFVKVYVNDRYIGIYNNTESIEKAFLRKHFDNDDGALFKCDPNKKVKSADGCPSSNYSSLEYLGDNASCYEPYYELKKGDFTSYQKLIELTKILKDEPNIIHTILNVDQALWMLAFNNVMVNLDSYTGLLCHNYYLYFNPETSLFEPLVWDMNLSLGGFNYATKKAIPIDQLATMSPYIHYKTRATDKPLIVKLLSIPHYRKIYLAHLKTIYEENFANGDYLNFLQSTHNLLEAHVQEDPNKLYPYEAFRANLNTTTSAGNVKIIGLTELIKARTAYLSEHPLMTHKGPKIQTQSAQKFSNENLVIQASVFNSEKVYVYHRANSNLPYIRTEMLDDGAHNDLSTQDQTYGATINYVQGTQYYIVAEDSKIAETSPARASKEFHTSP